MEKVGVNRTAEAPDNNASHHQRHAEIEIPAQEVLERIGCRCIFYDTASESRVPNGHRHSPFGAP
jgi:hypothetical protein